MVTYFHFIFKFWSWSQQQASVLFHTQCSGECLGLKCREPAETQLISQLLLTFPFFFLLGEMCLHAVGPRSSGLWSVFWLLSLQDFLSNKSFLVKFCQYFRMLLTVFFNKKKWNPDKILLNKFSVMAYVWASLAIYIYKHATHTYISLYIPIHTWIYTI